MSDATVERAVAEAMAAWPTMMARDAAVVSTREDLRASLRIIAAAMLVDDLDVVAEYVRWFEDTLAPRGLPVGFVPASFELLLHQLPSGLTRARAIAHAGIEVSTSAPLPRG